MEELILKLEKIVLDNRSLAENNPMAMARFSEGMEVLEAVGENSFKTIVKSLLDLNE